MKKNVFISVSKKELTVNAMIVLVSAALLVLAVILGSSVNNMIKVILYAFSLAAANYKTAVDTIEGFFEKRFSSKIFMIIGALVLFLVGYYEIAALISIIYCFGEFLVSYLNGIFSRQYIKDNSRNLSYAVKNGDEYVNTSADDLKTGDKVLCAKGQYICFDGIIENGAAQKKVFAGVSKEESAVVTITTVYDYNVDFSRFAKYSKSVSKIERLAAHFEKIYPLIIFAVAVIYAVLFLVLGTRLNSILFTASLVLMLSTALSVISGIYESNALLLSNYKSRGLTLRGSAQFDNIVKIKNIVLNKNNVLVRGEYTVGDVQCAEKYTEKEVISVLAAIQPNFDNPFAKALNEKLGGAPDRRITSKYLPHLGIVAEYSGKSVVAGSKLLMQQQGIDVSMFDEVTVYLAIDNKAIGAVKFDDRLKSDSVKALKLLKSLGIKTTIVTSDNDRTAGAVASKCGVDEYYAMLLTDEKAEIIDKAKKLGYTAYVGDEMTCAKHADFSLACGKTDEENYMVGDSLYTFAKAIDGAKKLNTIIYARFLIGLVVNLVMLILVLLNVLSAGNIWLIAIVQTLLACAPLAISGNITFEKKNKK